MNSYVDELQKDGFVVMKKVFSTDLLNSLLAEIKTGQLSLGGSSNVPRLNRGSDIIYSPFLKDKRYFDLFREPVIESILKTCLNDDYYKNVADSPNYILRSMICRSSKEMLPWHIDSFIPFVSEYASTVQVIIPLEKFTTTNGATLLYKGSHQFGKYSPQEHSNENNVIELHAVPGDVVIWDARIWHAAKENTSGSSRWAVISTFTRWWIKQNFRYSEQLLQSGQLSQYSDEDLILLGAASETPLNHHESIDLKGGFERVSALRNRECDSWPA